MEKNRILRILVAPMVLSLLFLSGCDTTESTLGGGTIGTAAGAGIGYALGGKGGAIIGGILGGGLGAAGGHYAGRTNEEKESLAQENARLCDRREAKNRRRLHREIDYDYNDDDDYYYDDDDDRYVRRKHRRVRYDDDDDDFYRKPSKSYKYKAKYRRVASDR